MGADFGMTCDPGTDDTLLIEKIGKMSVRCLVRAGSPLAERPEIGIQMLRDMPIIAWGKTQSVGAASYYVGWYRGRRYSFR